MSALGNVLDSAELGELANELTGGTGLADDATAVPDSLAADIESYDQHQAEKGLQLEQEDQVDDHRPRKGEVPLGALKEERQRRQELQAENARLLAERQQLNAQWQQLQQRLAQEQQLQQQAAEAAVPSFEEDPAAYIAHREKQFAQQLEQIRGEQVQRQQAEQLQQHVVAKVQQIAPELDATERQFEAEHPSYRAAFDFLDAQAEAQLCAAAPQATPAERQLLKTLALVELAERCRAEGANPCQRVFEEAQRRGFQPGQRQPSSAPARQAPRPAPTSLGNLHGAVEPGGAQSFDLATIAQMSDSDFESAWQQMAGASKPKFAF